MFTAARFYFETDPSAANHPIAKQLLIDFSNFSIRTQQESHGGHCIQIKMNSLRKELFLGETLLPFFWQRKKVFVRGWLDQKQLKTRMGSLVHLDYTSWSISLFLSDTESDYDEFYLLLLSALSEKLEKQGWVRLHAAAIHLNEKIILLNWPAGFGKSTSAATLQVHGKGQVFSDETTWIFKSKVQAFPTRISVPKQFKSEHTKTIFSSEKKALQINKVPNSASVTQLFFPKIQGGHWPSLLWYFWSNSLGLGLAQMGPYYVRINNLNFILKVLFGRFYLLREMHRQIIFLKLRQGCPEQNLSLVLMALSET
jgi:hypothetical protein